MLVKIIPNNFQNTLKTKNANPCFERDLTCCFVTQEVARLCESEKGSKHQITKVHSISARCIMKLAYLMSHPLQHSTQISISDGLTTRLY